MNYRCYSIIGVLVMMSTIGLGWYEPVAAAPQRPPGPATVGLARADHLYLPGPVFAPPGIYPEGKIDYEVIQDLIDRAVAAFSGQSSQQFWSQMFVPTDRVGLMIDVQQPPVPIVLVDAIIARLVATGLRAENILIFATDERDLFAAGFSLRRNRTGVKCYGAESAGYRHGISRIVLDMCDGIINVACLRPDEQVGMRGTIANHLSCVPHTRRLNLLSDPQQLPSAAAEPIVRQRTRLHLLAALHPYYALPTPQEPEPRWEYRGLLLSTDPVAVDVMGYRILAAKRNQQANETEPLDSIPEYLRVAGEQYCLGQCHPDLITVALSGPGEDSLLEGQRHPLSIAARR